MAWCTMGANVQQVAQLSHTRRGVDPSPTATTGAELFECLLLDSDVAVNYCNWNYFAGVGNDPRNRRFKTVTQVRLLLAPAHALPASPAQTRRPCGLLPVVQGPACWRVLLRTRHHAGGSATSTTRCGSAVLTPRPQLLRSQGMQYDEDAVLAATWLPELAHLPPRLRHAPWSNDLLPAEQELAAAATAASAAFSAGATAHNAGAGMPTVGLGGEVPGPMGAAAAAFGVVLGRDYPLPIVDPVEQTGTLPAEEKARKAAKARGKVKL